MLNFVQMQAMHSAYIHPNQTLRVGANKRTTIVSKDKSLENQLEKEYVSVIAE